MEKKKKTGPDECCRAERQIGYEVRTLNQVIGRLVNSYQSKVDEKPELTACRGGSLVICTDIQKRLFPERPGSRISDGAFYCFRNPSGNGEERLITREPIPRDARLKRLVLTEKGMEFQMEIMENFDRIQKVLKSDIPQEKLECFLEVLDMIRENAQRECCLRDEN